MLSAQLAEAYSSKKRKYCPVRSALHHYIREGWTIEILTWVIGIRGLADTANLQMALSFLDIPQQKWRAIIEDTVQASVRALAYMHKIRYSSTNRQPTMDKVDQLAIARTASYCTDRQETTTTDNGMLRRDATVMEEANRQRQMEIHGLTRGRLDTTDTIISLKKFKRAERRGIGRQQHRMR